MKKPFLLLSLVGFSLISHAQVVLFESDLQLYSSKRSPPTSTTIYSPETQTSTNFLVDDSSLYVQRFDSIYGMTHSFSMARPENLLANPIATSTIDEIYYFYFVHRNRKQFSITWVNPSQKIHNTQQLPITLDDEVWLETFTNRGILYLLTIQKKSSILHLYGFRGMDWLIDEEIDLSAYAFSKTDYHKLSDILKVGVNNLKPVLVLHQIEPDRPTPLDITSEPAKIYLVKEQLFLTVDMDPDETIVVEISLDGFTHSVHRYPHQPLECKETDAYWIGNNSYLYKDVLFQIKTCNRALHVTAFDLVNQSLLASYKVDRKKEISFKNTPLYQNGGLSIFTRKGSKEMERTGEILRKITAGQAGISVYSCPDGLELTIGGYREAERHVGISVAYIGPIWYYSHITLYLLHSYKNSRSVYFKSLIDPDTFQHIPGELPSRAFDKATKFIHRNEAIIQVQTFFKVGNFYVFGYYDSVRKKYVLRKFTD